MASFYIHIPFCERKCIYCDFYSIAPPDSAADHHSLQNQFLSSLRKEIECRAEDSRFHEPVETIFFGGGTPSLLPPAEIKALLHVFKSYFAIQPDAEITLEANPGTVHRDTLAAFLDSGINRISLGIQSFHDEDLEFLTRIHTAQEAKQCVRDCVSAGFTNISFDLIFSLPRQTLQHWKSNLEQAVDLEPNHLSCYSLIVEPETPLFKMVQSGQVPVIDADCDAEMYEYTIDFLTTNGYQQYEISNFARSKFQCRHNINYWNHSPYLSFGPSAHSFWKNERWWNVSDLASYIEKLGRGTLPVENSEHLTDAQLMQETIYLELRSDGIDLEKFQTRFNSNFLVLHTAAAEDLTRRGYALIENNRFRLTSKGYQLCDEICRVFS